MEFIKNKNIVVLDIETTGFSAQNDKIIELYMLKVFNSQIIEEYYSKFNPGIEIPIVIRDLTGIWSKDVKTSPKIENEISKIKSFIGDSIIIGHNLKFDLSFLNFNLVSNNIDKLNNEVVDTMKLSRALLRNDVNNHKLSTLSNHFKTSNKNEHNAKADVLTTYEVFKHLSRNGKIKDKKNINELNSYLNGLDDDLKKRFPNAESAPKSEGIYYFIKNNSIQYVGKSNNLKNRIRTHLSYSRTYKSNKIVSNSDKLEYVELSNELISLLAEHRMINSFKTRFNRSGKISKNIYWVKLKNNKINLEISRLENTKNTLYKFGPFLSYSKAISYKMTIEEVFKLIKCKKNNSRKSKCDIATLLGTECSCIEYFNFEEYLYKTKESFISYFDNLEKNINVIEKNVKNFSKNLEYEKAQKHHLIQNALEQQQEFDKFLIDVNQKDKKMIEKLSRFGIEINNQKVTIEEFSKLPDNFINKDLNNDQNIIKYLNELQIILRYLRKSETNKIVL